MLWRVNKNLEPYHQWKHDHLIYTHPKDLKSGKLFRLLQNVIQYCTSTDMLCKHEYRTDSQLHIYILYIINFLQYSNQTEKQNYHILQANACCTYYHQSLTISHYDIGAFNFDNKINYNQCSYLEHRPNLWHNKVFRDHRTGLLDKAGFKEESNPCTHNISGSQATNPK